jgi:hypothetical protein
MKRPMKLQIWTVTCALGIAACSGTATGTGATSGSSGDPQSSSGTVSSSGGPSSSGGGSGSTVNATPTLVGDWLLKLPIGGDEIVMSSTRSGQAQLYWYDGGQSKWQVSASDDGSGAATLTLSCTSSDCASADDIVYDCTYTLIALKCTGLSGGMMNNYKGDELDLTKQN